jgi:hypothetical protein
MSDTTAFVAGCATTGVAVLVLLVSRVGFGPSESPRDRVDLNAVEVPAAVPVPSPPSQDPAESAWQDELRDELARQRELTSKLESQLAQQEMLARNLENQLKQQQDETRAVISQLNDYKHSMDTLSLQNSQLMVEANQQSGGLQKTLVWMGGAFLLVLLLGGGGLILCVLLMAFQSQRRQERSTSVIYHPLEMPTPPTYRYYEQEFLPPASVRRQRVNPYYDYEV